MAKQKRYRLKDSDRSGFTFKEIELVKDGNILVGPGEFDSPPPSRQSTGGEGDMDRSGIRANWESYDAEEERLTQFVTASGGITYQIIPDSQGKSDPNNSWIYVAGSNITFDTATKLLVHFDGSNASTVFTDKSGNGHVITGSGNAQITTTQFVFGSASLLLDGTGDYVQTPASADFNLGSGDFEIDFRIRFVAIATSVRLCGSWTTGSRSFLLSLLSSGTVLDFRSSVDGTNVVTTNTFSWTPILNTWYHVLVSRSNGIIRAFIDGTKIGTDQANADNFFESTGTFEIGAGAGLSPVNGQIDEFRVSKGTARWFSNFDPPTSEYAPPPVAVDITKNPQISRGQQNSMLTLQSVGDPFILENGNGLSMRSVFTMDSGSILNMIYNATDNLWYETSRSHETRSIEG